MGRNKSNTSAKRDLNDAQAELVRAKARFWNELADAIRALATTAVYVPKKESPPAGEEETAPGEEEPGAKATDAGILDMVGRALDRHGVKPDD